MSSDSVDIVVPWVKQFCQRQGNEFFCEVDRSFIEERYNLFGLQDLVSNYQDALNLILDRETEKEKDPVQASSIETEAEKLYGLIHARFILTDDGIQEMCFKYIYAEFGSCPRNDCPKQAVMPIGESVVVGESKVQLYCPKCRDIYYPPLDEHRLIDGAFFGDLPHMFFMSLETCRPRPSMSEPRRPDLNRVTSESGNEFEYDPSKLAIKDQNVEQKETQNKE